MATDGARHVLLTVGVHTSREPVGVLIRSGSEPMVPIARWLSGRPDEEHHAQPPHPARQPHAVRGGALSQPLPGCRSGTGRRRQVSRLGRLPGYHDSFRRVAATWTVPALTCSATTPAGDPDSYFSVGLGPKVSHSERVGVRQLCTGAVASYVSYVQINGLYEVQAIDPAVGDKISARVSYRHGRYRFSLTDVTQSLSFSHRYKCGALSAGQGTCSRTTARVGAGLWAPHRSPLADYGKVVFSDIAVTDGGGHH